MMSVKGIISSLLFVLLFFIISKNVSAQGTFTCGIYTYGGCYITSNNCDTGYHAPGNNGSNCQILGYGCNTDHECISNDEPPPELDNTFSCGLAGAGTCGVINNQCDDAHIPGSCGSAQYSCGNETPYDCIPKSSLPNTYGCSGYGPTGCTRTNVQCQEGFVPGTCENNCGNPSIPCISVDDLSNTCSCGNKPYCIAGNNECKPGFYCPCEYGYCDTDVVACVRDGTIPPPRGLPVCNENGQTGVDTAIGCIPIGNGEEFMRFLFRWGIGIAGGVSFLLMVYAGFLIQTSQGNPKRLQGGKELLTAAISGLLLVIFSATLLRLIGVDILNLPNFGR